MNTEATPTSKKSLWGGRIIGALPTIFLLMDGGMKLVKPTFVVEATVKMGYTESVRPHRAMSTSAAFPYDILSVISGGVFVCALLWYFARQRIHQSRCWLALFSILFAATITPTCFPDFFLGGCIVAPASWISLVVIEKSYYLLGCLFGVLPILIVASLSFVILSRRFRHEVVA